MEKNNERAKRGGIINEKNSAKNIALKEQSRKRADSQPKEKALKIEEKKALSKVGRNLIDKDISVYSNETLNFYMFEQTVISFSLLFKNRIIIDTQEEVFMTEKHPIILKMLKDQRLDSNDDALRLDMLSGFILREQKKARNFEDIFFDEIASIPMPPYFDDDFLAYLKECLVFSSQTIEDNAENELLEGYSKFVSALTLLKEKVYPSLFAFLKTGNLLKQESKRRRACSNYASFLKLINKDILLFKFCKGSQLRDLIGRKKDILTPTFKTKNKTSDDSKFLKNEKISENLFSSYEDAFYSISKEIRTKGEEPTNKTIFAPIFFSGAFHLDHSSLFATSISDLILNYEPILDNENNAGYGANDINSLFFYKRYSAMGAERYLPSNIKEYDEKLYDFLELTLGNSESNDFLSRTKDLKVRTELLKIIEEEVSSAFIDIEELFKRKLDIIFGKKIFSDLRGEEQIFLVLSQYRLLLRDRKKYLPNIEDSFYLAFRNEIIVKKTKEYLKIFFKYYKDKKTNKVFSSKEEVKDKIEGQSTVDEAKDNAVSDSINVQKENKKNKIKVDNDDFDYEETNTKESDDKADELLEIWNGLGA